MLKWSKLKLKRYILPFQSDKTIQFRGRKGTLRIYCPYPYYKLFNWILYHKRIENLSKDSKGVILCF